MPRAHSRRLLQSKRRSFRTWLRTAGDPAAAAVAKATTALLRQLAPDGKLAAVLVRFLELRAPISPFRGEEVERVEQALRAYAHELMGR